MKKTLQSLEQTEGNSPTSTHLWILFVLQGLFLFGWVCFVFVLSGAYLFLNTESVVNFWNFSEGGI